MSSPTIARTTFGVAGGAIRGGVRDQIGVDLVSSASRDDRRVRGSTERRNLALCTTRSLPAHVGELAFSAAWELSRVATRETETAWLATAADKSLREIEKLVTGHKRGALPTDPPGEDVRDREVRLVLSPEAFAKWRELRKDLDAEISGTLTDDDLVDVVDRRGRAEGSAPSTRPTHQIATTICERCDRAWQDGAGAVVEIGASDVPPGTVEIHRRGESHVQTRHANRGSGRTATFDRANAATITTVSSVIRTQATAALVGLGWKPPIAGAAIAGACAALTAPTLEALIREALRRCTIPLARAP